MLSRQRCTLPAPADPTVEVEAELYDSSTGRTIVPFGAGTLAEALRFGAETFYRLRVILDNKGYETSVGDEQRLGAHGRFAGRTAFPRWNNA